METELFSRFRAHYGFRIRFCNPKSGWEKGNVENKVGTIRRNIFVPIPHYHDMISYNKQLLDEHLKKAAEMHYKKGEVIAELFEEDKRHFSSLPSKRFNISLKYSIRIARYLYATSGNMVTQGQIPLITAQHLKYSLGIPGHGETAVSGQMHLRYCVIIWIPYQNRN